MDGQFAQCTSLSEISNDYCLLSSLIAVPATAKPPPETSTSPIVVNYTSNPSVSIHDKQTAQAGKKTNLGLILGVVFGVLVGIIAVFITFFIIARRKRSPRLE